MQSKVFSFLFIILTASLIIPVGYSYAQVGNQTDMPSNHTDVSSNQTGTVSETNIGQQVEDLVHQYTDLFKQQRNETLNAIKDCREKIQNATSDQRSQVRDECKTMMKTIHEKYQDDRTQFQQLFKQFREDIVVLRHEAQGEHVSQQEKENALSHINEKAAKTGIRGITIARGHLKGHGENGMMGIEMALNHTTDNNATEIENKSSVQYPTHPQPPMMGSNPSSEHGKR